MPTTTTGVATEFITFSRPGATGGGATVTDSDGLVKWAQHNLLTNSESFDAAAWSKNHITSVAPTVVANDGVAPNGTTTADKVVFGAIDAAGDTSTITQSFTAEAASYTGGFWIKGFAAGDVGKSISVYLNDGTLKGQIFVTVTADWQYVTTSGVLTSGASRTFHVSTVGSTYGGANQAAVTVYLWGASLYRSDLAMQPNTSAYPMYNPTTVKNALGYTENFNVGWSRNNGGVEGNGVQLVTATSTVSGGWTESGGIVTAPGTSGTTDNVSFALSSPTVAGRFYEVVVPNNMPGGSFYVDFGSGTGSQVGALGASTQRLVLTCTAPGSVVRVGRWVGSPSGTIGPISVQEIAAYEAPNGLQTARAVEATAANGTLLSSLSLLASPYTFSIWLKRKSGGGDVQLTVDGTTYATVAVTGTWTRFSTTLTPTAGTKTPGIRLVTSGDAVYVWGAQLSDSASLDSYVPVYGAAVTSAAYYGPRRDFDPVTLACKGLLVEEQRTNLLLYSAEFDNAYWSKTNATISANAVAAPSGVSTADKIFATSATGAHYAGTGSITISASTSYTASVYLKAAEYGWAILYIGSIGAGQYINLSTGALGSTFIGAPTSITVSNAGSGWWRVSMVVASGANTVCDMRVYATTANSVSSFAGDDVSGIYAWGAQLEAGSFATSYIPTGAATATRNADVASVSTQAFPYSSTEGTVVANFMPLLVSPANLIFNLGAGSDGNSLYSTAGASQNLVVRSAGSTTVNLATGGFTVGQASKLGAAFKSSDYAVVTNGGTAATVGSGALPTGSATTFALGGGATLAGGGNGHIRQITYLPRRISNTELQTRTA